MWLRPLFFHCGVSQPPWFGSFQSDQRFTVGKRRPRAVTNCPYSAGFGLQMRRALAEPPHEEAHAGPGPVGVRSTVMSRAAAPATSASSSPRAYALGSVASKLGLLLDCGLGA